MSKDKKVKIQLTKTEIERMLVYCVNNNLEDCVLKYKPITNGATIYISEDFENTNSLDITSI